MRGADVQQLGMFSYVSVEERAPKDHPIRKLRTLVGVILGELDDVVDGAMRRTAGSRFRRRNVVAGVAVASGVQRAQRSARTNGASDVETVDSFMFGAVRENRHVPGFGIVTGRIPDGACAGFLQWGHSAQGVPG